MFDPSIKEVGQLIFVKDQPEISCFNSENPCVTELSYNLQGKSSTEIQILVGLQEVTENDLQDQASLHKTLVDNIQNAQKPVASLPMVTFDYKAALEANSVSYIANRDSDLNPKFASDPEFSLVFINKEVAIFKVRANTN
jgi:hypothetical protein